MKKLYKINSTRNSKNFLEFSWKNNKEKLNKLNKLNKKMTLKQYYKQLKIAENYAQQNNWLAVRNTLWNWFIEIQANSNLIDEKGLTLLLNTALNLNDNDELNSSIEIYEFAITVNPNNKTIADNLIALKSILSNNLDTNFLSQERAKFLTQCQSRNSSAKLKQTENNISRKNFPYLNRFPDELPERAKILLQPIGRSGSIFFHSLIDGHPQIATLPNVVMMYFFYTPIWRYLRPDYKENNWQKILIEKFCLSHKILFDNNEKCRIPGIENLGIVFLKNIGLNPTNNPSDNFGYFGVDKEKFVYYLEKYLHDKKYISQACFFDLLHAAYQYSLGRNINTNFDFYHIHLPNKAALTNCIYLYKNVKLLGIIRNPIQAIESYIKGFLYINVDIFNTIDLYRDVVNLIFVSIGYSFMLFNNILPSIVIRLEDLKRKTDDTLHQLCGWFGVNYSNTLLEETFGNRKFNTPSQQNIKGFDSTNIDSKIGTLFADKQDLSARDYRILNIILYPLSVKYKYKQNDNLYFKNELKYLQNELSKNKNYLFDFELPLQQKLKNDGVNEYEIYNIHKIFRRSLLPFLDYLEKYQTYPGLAELLEV